MDRCTLGLEIRDGSFSSTSRGKRVTHLLKGVTVRYRKCPTPDTAESKAPHLEGRVKW
ncbi:hypothetical protein LEMLEM_LOCUS24736, partial [Lemmus lemmus]